MIMSEFEKLKATLNDKWLDYYEVNCSWIIRILPKHTNGYNQYVDSETLAYVVLGVITAIKPKVKEFLELFSELNQDPRSILRVLSIDYLALDEKLKERPEERAKNPKFNSSEIDEIERIRQQLSKGEL